MSNPFAIDGPAMISFSGGRTSAFMLHQILTVGGGPSDEEDVHVLFANTGKEREETLQFVEDCTHEWGVVVHWVERGRGEVTFETASRNGEPFEALIAERRFLPNPVMRFCTQELKIRPMREWMRAYGYEHWTNVVGIRADEPRRVAKMRGTQQRERSDITLPLADAGVTLEDVTAFWRRQSFDLRLQPHEGNCDLCFLKGLGKRRQIVRDRPDLAVWWIQQEQRSGATFRNDTPSFAQLAAQPDLFTETPDLIECYCTD